MSRISNQDQQVDKEKFNKNFDRIFGENHRHQFCINCNQPIPGLQAGEICEECLTEGDDEE